MGSRLANEVAIVTGSSGLGVGTEIAKVFAAEGACVVATGRSVERGEAVAEAIRDAGGSAAFVAADLLVEKDCRALVEQTIRRFGRLSVLVNSAVSVDIAGGAVAQVGEEQWELAMRAGVAPTARMCRYALPAMQTARRGSIVNIGSRVATRGVAGLAAYTAGKGAVHALTRSIAVDYASDGIRCNTVAPGYIVGKERSEAGRTTTERLEWAQGMHLTRLPNVTDVAYAALYLACQESAAITGATIPVDGGGSIARGLTLG